MKFIDSNILVYLADKHDGDKRDAPAREIHRPALSDGTREL